VKEANIILGYINSRVVQKTYEVILPLVKSPVGSRFQFWVPHSKKDCRMSRGEKWAWSEV